MKSDKSRAYPRRLVVPKKDDEKHIEELIEAIPYKHNKKKYKIDGVTVYHLRLKTQEILALKLAGYEIKK